jgi:hypothetical protein
MEEIVLLQKKAKLLYKEIKLNHLFKKYPRKVKGLTFGYICPGAMKTVEFLNSKSVVSPETLRKIKMLTDFQFFIEIMVVYKDYLDKDLVKKMKAIIGNKSCSLSSQITEEITRLFGTLPKKIKLNLPDDFYHIRHNTLICSKNKKLAKQRIKLLMSIYSGGDNSCIGARDGVSGCRTCCNSETGACVDKCMIH